MRKITYRKFFTAAAMLILPFAGAGYAEEISVGKATDISLTAEPAQYTFVDGNKSRFRALNWMDDGYAGGVGDSTMSEKLKDGVLLEAEGHAIPAYGDYSGLVRLKKEDVGYINFDYNQFRSYYGNAGGFYQPFNRLNQIYMDKDLALNNGKFGVEMGLIMKNFPDITLDYVREFKIGTKSRLDWALVTDNVAGVATQRKIAPAWQRVHQTIDSFGAKISDTTMGFNWKAEQKWRSTRSHDMSEEKQFTALSGPTNADAMITDQAQVPRQDLLTTTVGVNRWFMKDKVYASGGYRFSRIRSHELDNLFQTDGNGVPTNFSADSTILRQWRDATANNHYDANNWVGSLMVRLMNPLTMITRFEAETIHRKSDSVTPSDDAGTAPDGIIDHSEIADNNQKIERYGQSVSFRYSGIPRMSLYNDYEFEQTRDNLSESWTDITTGGTIADNFWKHQISHRFCGTGTLGAQFAPWKQVTMTLQWRYWKEDIHYNRPNLSGDFMTVLIDSQNTQTSEAMARATWKACRWFQPSFRYQLMDRTYQTVTYGFNKDRMETDQISHVFTWDVVSQLLDDLVMTGSFSFQNGEIITPVRAPALGNIPTFDYDVYTTLFSFDYALNKDLMLVGVADYTRSANFNDFSSTGMPYGADFHKTDVTLSLSWKPRKDLTIEPKYAYYEYSANRTDRGRYNAQMVSLEANLKCW